MSGLQKTGRAIGPRPQDSGNFMIAKLALFSDCRILAKVYQRNTNPMKQNLYIDFKLQSSNVHWGFDVYGLSLFTFETKW